MHFPTYDLVTVCYGLSVQIPIVNREIFFLTLPRKLLCALLKLLPTAFAVTEKLEKYIYFWQKKKKIQLSEGLSKATLLWYI